jgi:hypothetical protein
MRFVLVAIAILMLPEHVFAGGPSSGVKGGCGRGTTYRSSPPTGVVHVSGYTRKDGTYVAGYDRTRADGDPSNNFSSPNPIAAVAKSIPLPTHRTKARTEPRTATWNGTGSEPESDRKVRFAPPPVVRAEEEMRTWHSGTHSVEARFVSLSSGKVKLHTIDGRDITIDLDKLSADDQAWIERRR